MLVGTAGIMRPEDRDKILADMRNHEYDVLVATDVCGRGLDLQGVALVVNYDMPVASRFKSASEALACYIHRTGRCGRFGRVGKSVTLFHTYASQMAAIAKVEDEFLGYEMREYFV